MRRRPLGISLIAVLYFCGAAGYSALLLAWLFSRDLLVNGIERFSPTEFLGPTLLLQMPMTVSFYFMVMAGFCAVVGRGLWKLQRWSWVVTLLFVAMSLSFDGSLLVHLFTHLSPWLISVAILRLLFLVALLAYLWTPGTHRAFARRRETAAGV
jgi:hypothetical protein